MRTLGATVPGLVGEIGVSDLESVSRSGRGEVKVSPRGGEETAGLDNSGAAGEVR
jgi:hypothetical protein